MVSRSIREITEKIGKKDRVYIIPSGKAGKEAGAILREHDIQNINYLDNNPSGVTEVAAVSPKAIKPELTYFFIIATYSTQIRAELKKQLSEIGIKDEMMIIYYPDRDMEYMMSIPEDDYKSEISDMYKEVFDSELNWDKPSTYNEIINVEKIYDRSPIRTKLADKCQAREWVREKIGNDHLTRQYGNFDNVENMDFSILPMSFVLKTNNGSGRNIIVKNKEYIDIDSVKKELKSWLEDNYAYNSLEMHYKDIVPKIIVEELLDSDNPNFFDFKIYCFRGKPKYIQCIRDEHKPNMKARIYDENWKLAGFNHAYADDEMIIDKPLFFEEMMKLTQTLCKGFDHVRIDWFVIPEGKFLFSEMTFSDWAGLKKFNPEKWDRIFGDLTNGIYEDSVE